MTRKKEARAVCSMFYLAHELRDSEVGRVVVLHAYDNTVDVEDAETGEVLMSLRVEGEA